MTENLIRESAQIDAENNLLIDQLFRPETQTKAINSLATLPNYAAHSPDNSQVAQAMPAIGDLIYLERDPGNTSSDTTVVNLSIQFRKDGTIILTNKGDNFLTKYTPLVREVMRSDRTQPSTPDQPLPRRSKLHFLKTIHRAQDFILSVTTQETVT